MVTVIKDDTQVTVSSNRRRFTAEYKLKILKEAEECRKIGMIGALLRREGLYSSRLSDWKNARERGELEALTPLKRGRKSIVVDPKDQRIAKLEGQLKKANARAERAEALVELQKKLQRCWELRSKTRSHDGFRLGVWGAPKYWRHLRGHRASKGDVLSLYRPDDREA